MTKVNISETLTLKGVEPLEGLKLKVLLDYKGREFKLALDHEERTKGTLRSVIDLDGPAVSWDDCHREVRSYWAHIIIQCVIIRNQPADHQSAGQ